MRQTITELGLANPQPQAFHPGLASGLALDPLCAEMVTPAEKFYVHNHGNVPRLDAALYGLSVLGEVARPLCLALTALREEFPKQTILTTLKCSGHQAPTGLPCHVNAAGTAIWGGVSLFQVLYAAGLKPTAQHVAFAGLDVVEVKTQQINYGCSIPLETAWRAEVLLAYEMNGEPLTAEHGAPLRLIVPGETGAKSVKWLREIKLLPFPSTNYFQSRSAEDALSVLPNFQRNK